MVNDMSVLQCRLPEDIQRKKMAGYIREAAEAVEARLAMELPVLLRERLLLEREMLRRVATGYRYGEKEALAMMQEAVPGFTEEEFRRLEAEGRLDFMYVEGEKRYFVRFLKGLLKADPLLAARSGKPLPREKEQLDALMEEVMNRGHATYDIAMRMTLAVEDEAFIPNETYRVYLPIPAAAAQITNIEIMEASPKITTLAKEDAPQRTALFEEFLTKNRPFSISYRYRATVKRVDFEKSPMSPLYPGAKPWGSEDLAEELPHICFTPLLRALKNEVQGQEIRPLQVARRFYDYVTTKVNYAYMRPYFLIEDAGEYAALNQKGDCGLQALLFITLCRMAGIPARWQSGLAITPEYIDGHDWAQFYVEPWGWLFCDCSYGGGAYRAGHEDRWNFYFGHIDPFRMVANSRFQAEFQPPMQGWRVDPYDNQYGECERDSGPLPGKDVDVTYTLLEMKSVDGSSI